MSCATREGITYKPPLITEAQDAPTIAHRRIEPLVPIMLAFPIGQDVLRGFGSITNSTLEPWQPKKFPHSLHLIQTIDCHSVVIGRPRERIIPRLRSIVTVG